MTSSGRDILLQASCAGHQLLAGAPVCLPPMTAMCWSAEERIHLVALITA